MKKGEARVGCSGWQYRHWRGDFYPQKLPQKEWLEYYGGVFDTVEVNNTFYRLPEISTFAAWRDRTDARFLFAVKASRYLTHRKRLKEPADPLKIFWERARALQEKLGPVLYQLPTGWSRNDERFYPFLDALPKDAPQTVEFRDPSWYSDEIYHALESKGISMCLHDMPGSAPPRRAIGPFVYVRFHGSDAEYQGGYSNEALLDWAQWLAQQARSGKNVYAYFNNDAGGHAPRDAMRLRGYLLDQI